MFEELVALTGIEPEGCQFGPVQLGRTGSVFSPPGIPRWRGIPLQTADVTTQSQRSRGPGRRLTPPRFGNSPSLALGTFRDPRPGAARQNRISGLQNERALTIFGRTSRQSRPPLPHPRGGIAIDWIFSRRMSVTYGRWLGTSLHCARMLGSDLGEPDHRNTLPNMLI